MLFLLSLAFLGKLCIYPEGGRVVFLAGSKMSQCLVCRQLWFSYIFREFLSPVPFESPGAYIDSQDTGDWGLQGIAGHSTRA